MKKIVMFVLAVMLIMLVTPLGAFAQNEGSSTFDTSVFASLAAFAAFLPFAVEFIKKLLKVPEISIVSQLLSWLVGLLLAIAGWALHIGMFAALLWWQAILVGFGASLIANGVFDTGLITWIFSLLKVNTEKK